MFVCLGVVVGDLVVLGGYLRWENRRRDRIGIGIGIGGGDRDGEGLVDVTDLRNRGFRYVY